jgi:hypothetical protein
MRVSLLCSVASVFLASAAFAQGEGEFPATLKGHAVLANPMSGRPAYRCRSKASRFRATPASR